MSFSESTHEVRMLAVLQKLIGDGVDVRAHLTHEPWIELGDHAPLESILKALEFFRSKKDLEDNSIASDIKLKNSKINNSLILRVFHLVLKPSARNDSRNMH